MKKLFNYFKNNFYLSLSILYIFLYLPIIFLRFQDLRNEIKYFLITQEFLNNRDLFILRYLSELYPDKPPLYFWILAFSHKISNKYFPMIAIILGSTLASYIIVILIYKILLKFTDKKIASITAFSLATLPVFLGMSVFLRMDMLMTMFITFSLYLFWGFYYNWFEINYSRLGIFYLSIFLAIFTKGVAGLAIPFLVIISFLLLEKNLSFLKEIKLFKGIVLIILLIVLWFILIYFSKEGIEYIKLMLGQETLGRIIKSKAHIKPIYYYIKILPGMLFPYIITIFLVLYRNLKNIKSWSSWNEIEKISFIWFIVPLLMFSIASGKLAVYLLPILPPAIILIVINIIKNNGKYTNYFLSLSEIILVFPIFYKIIAKKIGSNFERIKVINLTSIFILFILTFSIKLYNNQYTIKPFLPLIEKNKTIAYSFADGENLQYFTNYPIKNYSNISDISHDNHIFIITKRKYSSNLKAIDYKVIYENKEYSILKK